MDDLDYVKRTTTRHRHPSVHTNVSHALCKPPHSTIYHHQKEATQKLYKVPIYLRIDIYLFDRDIMITLIVVRITLIVLEQLL
jgi:hypothetical protein